MIDYVHEYGLDLKNNQIFLMGEKDYIIGTRSENSSEPGVEYVMTNKFIKNIQLCLDKNPSRPLKIHMKTCGGDWSEGMAIYDTIKAYPNHVTILNYTHARSMSSLIFSAADKRVMMPHSYFMFHEGTYSIEGTVKQVNSNISFDNKSIDIMVNIYAELMNNKGKLEGKGLLHIRKWIKDQMNKKEDVFLTAKETVEYGLADEIFDYNWKNL